MEKPALVFLVNGEANGAMGIRARSFEQRLADEFRIEIAYRSSRKVQSIAHMLRTLLRVRPGLCYVFDMSFSGVIAAALYRAVSRSRTIVDTGDAIYELSRSSGIRGPVGQWLTKLLERFALWSADRVVVRSHPHQEWLAERGVAADVVPDGVDTRQFSPQDSDELRRRYGLEGCTVIGLLGSLIWSPSLEMCYGWELVELLALLRDRPVKGVIIGDGSGLEHLKAACRSLGVEDRILFLGRLPYDELPGYLSVMDICLSTQTNDAAGQVRTTGKLPLYLACGRFVLSTEVGEAARILPPEMLVPYEGTKDLGYPRRLADRVRGLLAEPDRLRRRATLCIAIAQTNFDYNVLAVRVRRAILESLRGHSPDPKPEVVNSR
jgi:glycosyltransferase involved in cell wall biosynthesis